MRFLIGKEGLSVLPVTSIGLTHEATHQRISTGIARLDEMLGGKGYFRGSSVLVSGTAGSGKTSIAAAFVDAAARRGERGLYFAFEESESQILRNMRSIGIDLQPWVERGLLEFHARRPTVYGLEAHLLSFHEAIRKFKPRVVVMDPITNFLNAGNDLETKSMLTRLIDYLKTEQCTAVFSSLTSGAAALEQSEVGVSSLMDTWLLVRNLESGGERNRGLYILKSRGMAHSNQIREFVLSDRGIALVDVYAGPGQVLTGSARQAQESRDKAEAVSRREALARLRREAERERQQTEAQIAGLRGSLEARLEELNQEIAEATRAEEVLALDRREMESKRTAGDGKAMRGRGDGETRRENRASKEGWAQV